MEVIYQPKAIEDILFWKRSGNKNIQHKISMLINAIKENPFTSIGKPEPLKHNLSGMWSRRITNEHRIVYEIADNSLHIYSLKDHYIGI